MKQIVNNFVKEENVINNFLTSLPPSLSLSLLQSSFQEKVEDSCSGSVALPALQTQEQALSSGMAPGVHPPMAGGKQI